VPQLAQVRRGLIGEDEDRSIGRARDQPADPVLFALPMTMG